MNNEKEKEKRNIFEHIADAVGSKDSKSLFGGKKAFTFGFDEFKKLIISFAIYAFLGLVIGTICDILLGTGYLSIVMCLVFIVFWILRKFGKYLK